MISKLEKLVRVLVNGYEIEHDGARYCLSEDDKLCMIAKDDFGCDVYLTVDADISWLSKVAKEIDEDYLFLTCCSISLTEMKK